MNPASTLSAKSIESFKAELRERLFPDTSDERLTTYAVLDGASIPELIDHLYEDPHPEFVCLYRGALEPDMAEVAPYLVQLQPESPFTDWLLTDGWGRHWGIFAWSTANLAGVRQHFRTFLMVKNPEGKQVYFRYYDPRVLRVYLPTCSLEESAVVFGPLRAYLCEAEQSEILLTFALRNGCPKLDAFRLIKS